MTHLGGCQALHLNSIQLCLQSLEFGLQFFARLARLRAGFAEGLFSLCDISDALVCHSNTSLNFYTKKMPARTCLCSFSSSTSCSWRNLSISCSNMDTACKPLIMQLM